MAEKKEVTPYLGDTPGFTYRVRLGFKRKCDSKGTPHITYWRWSQINRRWLEVPYQQAKEWVDNNQIQSVGQINNKPWE